MSRLEGYDDGLTLASLDSLGDPDELRAQARSLLGDVPDPGSPPEQQEGADPSDSVWVSVDAHGRVLGVEISRQWRDRLEPAEFAGALFAAYVTAVQKAVGAAALAALAAEQEREREREREAERQREREAERDWDHGRSAYGYGHGGRDAYDRDAFGGRREAGPVPQSEPEPAVDEREWLNATWDVLDDLDRQLRRMPDLATGQEERERDISSPHGYLRLRLRGRGVVGITGDPRLMPTASTEQLRLEAIAVFRAAQTEI